MGKYFNNKKTKSGYLICVVPMCQTKKSTTTLKTFEFPSDLKRRGQWTSAIVEATLKNEEKFSLEDLYALENRRMELEMEITNALGDHSYVCARHFKPNDIVVHPNVCRLTANAVPSVFSNYSTDLPRQFFKKVCQTARSLITVDDSSMVFNQNADDQVELVGERGNSYLQDVVTLCMTVEEEEIEKITNPEHFDSGSQENDESEFSSVDYSQSSRACYVVNRGTNTKLKYTGVSNTKLGKNKMRKKIRLLETRCKNMKRKINELENKQKLYNIEALERDAENNNEEALFLLDMLRSYTTFEKTREEILTANTDVC